MTKYAQKYKNNKTKYAQKYKGTDSFEQRQHSLKQIRICG